MNIILQTTEGPLVCDSLAEGHRMLAKRNLEALDVILEAPALDKTIVFSEPDLIKFNRHVREERSRLWVW